MTTGDLAQWLIVGITLSLALGGFIGFMMKNNARIVVVETQMKQLQKLVGDNARTVQKLLIACEKLETVVQMRKIERQ